VKRLRNHPSIVVWCGNNECEWLFCTENPGKSPDEIATAVQAAYAKNEIPKREDVSFAYMWSADQVLGPAGHWNPHMMLFVPYYQNRMLGDNSPASHLPFVGDDEGTPFAVAVIPVDDKLAISAHQ